MGVIFYTTNLIIVDFQVMGFQDRDKYYQLFFYDLDPIILIYNYR